MSVSIFKNLKKFCKTKKGNRKSFHLLDYTREELYNHLISTLPDNYTEQDWLDGKLHIDHIIPQSIYTNEKEYLNKCWDLRNLQPLWAIVNFQKRDLACNLLCSGVIYKIDKQFLEQIINKSNSPKVIEIAKQVINKRRYK